MIFLVFMRQSLTLLPHVVNNTAHALPLSVSCATLPANVKIYACSRAIAVSDYDHNLTGCFVFMCTNAYGENRFFALNGTSTKAKVLCLFSNLLRFGDEGQMDGAI